MSWKDRTYDHSDDEGLSYPFVQVGHQPGQFDPRPESGGFFQPADQAAMLGAAIPGTPVTFYPGGGEGEAGVFCSAITIAVLMARQVILKGRGEGARVLDEWEDGAHSKVQAACLVRGENGEAIGPVTLSVKSTVARAFWQALREHRINVRSATGGKAPAYAFYWTFRATGTTQTSEGGMVTSFALADGAFDPDETYVGDEVLDGIDWDHLHAWQAAWDTGGADRRGGNGTGPRIKNPDAPATQRQRTKIRELLDEWGFTGDQRQLRVIEQAGYDAENLTKGAASDLITRLSTGTRPAGPE